MEYWSGGKEQEMECWSGGKEYGLEYWGSGVLGLKAEIGLFFTLLPLVMRDPNMICAIARLNN